MLSKVVDPQIQSEADRSVAELRQRLEFAQLVERQASEWMAHLTAHPPASDEERQHYRTKRDELRHLTTERLHDMAEATTLASQLLANVESLAPEDQVLVLRKHLGSILERAAATARALATVVEVCAKIDDVT